MLGEKIGEETGTITTQRVLPCEGTNPRLEVTFKGVGKILGTDCTDMGTYIAEVRPGGALLGQGQGLLMTKDGESITWTGTGVGKIVGKAGAASWRGHLCYQTTSTKFARLNTSSCIFEYDIDDHGNTKSGLWEWK